jgi:hypothetical protein
MTIESKGHSPVRYLNCFHLAIVAIECLMKPKRSSDATSATMTQMNSMWEYYIT